MTGAGDRSCDAHVKDQIPEYAVVADKRTLSVHSVLLSAWAVLLGQDSTIGNEIDRGK